jgi:hypothetical protein
MVMKIMEIDRLVLRTWSLEDVNDGLLLWGNKEVMRYVYSGKTLRLDEVKKSLQAGIDHPETNRYQIRAVVEKESQNIHKGCWDGRRGGQRNAFTRLPSGRGEVNGQLPTTLLQ